MTLQELFADESRWTKGQFAKTKTGIQTSAFDPNAVCWCLAGGVAKCYGNDGVGVQTAGDIETTRPLPFCFSNTLQRQH